MTWLDTSTQLVTTGFSSQNICEMILHDIRNISTPVATLTLPMCHNNVTPIYSSNLLYIYEKGTSFFTVSAGTKLNALGAPDGKSIIVEENGVMKVLVDTELSDASENPVNNKVIAARFKEIDDKLSEKFSYDKNTGVLKIETNRTDEFYYDNVSGILHIK